MLTFQVAWLYWPEELPPPKTKTSDTVNSISGQRTYHGSHELIASNYMEVLDVLSFAGKADVMQWEEQDDNLTSKLYWRQTFCRETQELSVSSRPAVFTVCRPLRAFKGTAKTLQMQRTF
jgi:hypothetical protein